MAGANEWTCRRESSPGVRDAAGIGYVRDDNCFPEVSDFVRAQELADEQPRIDWVGELDRVLRRVHPL